MNGHRSIKREIKQSYDSGPRHGLVLGDSVFTLHEKYDAQRTSLLGSTNIFTLSVTSTIREDRPFMPAKLAAAEILFPEVSPCSNSTQSYLYASSRNAGTSPDSQGDTITIFIFDNNGGQICPHRIGQDPWYEIWWPR